MHLALLGRPDSWYVRDLVRAAGERHAVTPVPFGELASTIGSDRAEVASRGIALERVDAVLVRTMPPGTLEQVVFRMDALARLEAAGVVVVNPPKALEAAVDKYLTTARLASAGLRVPETVTCQTVDDALAAFARLGGDVVVKPLFGGEGRGIARLDDEALALRAFAMLAQLGAVIYVQRFVPHAGHDLRLLVVGRRVLGIRREHPDDWRTNVSRGARAAPLEVTPDLADLARRAAEAVGTRLAGVDLLPGLDGKLYALEVNAVPGWRALGKALGVDVARLVLELVEKGM